VAAEQARVAADIEALGGTVVFTFNTLSSGLAVQAPGQPGRLASIPGVSYVSQVPDYTRDLAETVPFIGAEFLQDWRQGRGREGGRARLRHRLLAPGLWRAGHGRRLGRAYFGNDPACDPNAWHDADCAYAKPADPALFGPGAPRVKGGFDWLGEEWPNGCGEPHPA
jgi:minor extracellular serine protease Vpr